MEHENGWSALLKDPVFDHMEGGVERDDARRLLAVIGEEFYQKEVSVNIKEDKWAFPKRQDTIGYKAMAVRSSLDGLLREFSGKRKAPPAGKDSDWLDRFFDDLEFRHYASRLLESLCSCAWSSLPSTPQTASYEQREQETAQANAEELEDEIGRAEIARKSAEAAKEAADTAKATADSIMPNMLTTLGVFIAIVIAVVACYLSLILSEPFNGKELKTINVVMLLLMGHILLNIIFLLLYLISKMSAHPLSCHCLVGDQSDCQKCDPELRALCCFRHKLWLRYPYVVAMNGAFVAAYCGLGLWYLVWRYFGASIDGALTGTWQYAAAAAGTAAALIAAVVIFVFRFFLRSPRHKLEADQKREQKKQDSTQKKARKIENERRAIRKLEKDFNQQQKRITELEKAVNQMQAQLARYQQERDNTPVP